MRRLPPSEILLRERQVPKKKRDLGVLSNSKQGSFWARVLSFKRSLENGKGPNFLHSKVSKCGGGSPRGWIVQFKLTNI